MGYVAQLFVWPHPIDAWGSIRDIYKIKPALVPYPHAPKIWFLPNSLRSICIELRKKVVLLSPYFNQ